MLRCRAARLLSCATPLDPQAYLSAVTRYPRALRCQEYGEDILASSLWNKGLAFEMTERDRLVLRGLLPPTVRSLQDQSERTLRNIRAQPNDVARNMYLQELHCRNETLFHRVLLDNIEELAPLVYTPTVGLVCQQFGNQFRRPRGMFFSTEDRGHFSTMIYNWQHDDVHVIVVTDGSRILGLGDLGAQGMGIPIGKLALYCACGGIAPHRVLPITLDVGTNNEKLLEDPNYIGVRHRRLEGKEYYDMVDEFMSAVYGRFPEVCVQFEDFETPKAVPLLEKYRNTFRCFNDDIQGTGAVTLAATMAAARAGKRPFSSTRVLCAGAGSAGLGVCAAIVDGLMHAGVPRDQAVRHIAIADQFGLIGRPDGRHGNPHYKDGVLLNPMHLPWVNWEFSDGTPLVETARLHKPNVLLGLTATKGVFTEELIRAVTEESAATGTCRPLVMPLSNPTSKCECTPMEAVAWSGGRAVVATGSPFDSFIHDGVTVIPSQCNNMYVFPGLGLAASVGGVSRFSDDIMYTAAAAVADCATEEDLRVGRLFPSVKNIRAVAAKVAVAVIQKSYSDNQTTKVKKHHLREGLEQFVTRKMYFPDYAPLRSEKTD